MKFFRFPPRELGYLSDLINFNVIKARRRYRFSPITVTCIVLWRLSYPSRLFYLELFFGLPSQVLSEVFWEALEELQPNLNALLSMSRADLVGLRAVIYAQCIEGQDALFTHCIGFLDGTKIFMSRHCGPTAKKRAFYSGQKHDHFWN